jgi:hypothetical protein
MRPQSHGRAQRELATETQRHGDFLALKEFLCVSVSPWLSLSVSSASSMVELT